MNIAVYCSANNRIDEEYKSLGRELGQWLATNGHTLIFGGATGGLMTAVSEAARQHGGQIIGIVPDRIIRSGRKSEACTACIEVACMTERKQQMRDIADCFICLPGSYGTLDEMMDVIASGTVGEHKKPIHILNYKGFYNPLRQQIEQMRSLHFIPEQESYKPVFVETLEELFDKIKD